MPQPGTLPEKSSMGGHGGQKQHLLRCGLGSGSDPLAVANENKGFWDRVSKKSSLLLSRGTVERRGKEKLRLSCERIFKHVPDMTTKGQGVRLCWSATS